MSMSAKTISKVDNLIIYAEFINHCPGSGNIELIIKLIEQGSDSSKNWSGNLTDIELKTISGQLELQYEDYIEEIKNALTNPTDLYIYQIDKGQFILKKNGEFKIIYLDVNIISINDDNLKEKFLHSMIEINKEMNLRCKTIEEKYELNLNELKNLKELISMLREEKCKCEEDLLSKFILLLNSKKEKIAELQNLLYEKNQKPSTSSSDSTQQSKNNQNNEDTTDDETSYEADTQLLQQETEKVVNLPRRHKYQ